MIDLQSVKTTRSGGLCRGIDGEKKTKGKKRHIIADGGYRGELVENTKKVFGWVLEIVLRKEDSPKFQVIPQRWVWVVERTFAWFESYRRLSKDFKYYTETSQTMILLAMIKLMLNRINL
ncbi:hypothetical protein FACS189421_07880 [Bacteroidia bacterium]|nr:hypothetical protein FACS189421_07880 [Bacteroidia bacterium]GHT06730.1 hypothetical protein FACS189423_11620 [Bacteroidia bacterium]